MFAYEIDQTIYYIKDDRLHSAPVLSRMIVENGSLANGVSTGEQDQFFRRFGPARVMYATCHGEFSEAEVFGSREALANALVSG